MKFAELPRYADHMGEGLSGPGNAQREARRLFPAVVREQGLRVGRSARPRHGAGVQVVIGVAAAYAVRDLQLLDELAPALRAREDECVDLLDISGTEHATDFEELVPGSASTGQTPIVVVWGAGRFLHGCAGKAARDFLRSRYLGPS